VRLPSNRVDSCGAPATRRPGMTRTRRRCCTSGSSPTPAASSPTTSARRRPTPRCPSRPRREIGINRLAGAATKRRRLRLRSPLHRGLWSSRIAASRAAAWSPSGSWIVYANGCAYSACDLFRITPDGSRRRRLTHFPPLKDQGAPDEISFAWNATGTSVLYARGLGPSLKAVAVASTRTAKSSPRTWCNSSA
jgi:hypothetical protein